MNEIQFYKQTSQFTDLGKYKEDAIDLWENRCHKSLKTLCHYLMNVTVHRVVVEWALEGQDVHEYGNFSKLNFTTPMSEDDIFLTATSMYAEICRRDKKGFYIGRPVEKRLNLTCRYVSVLASAILKANGIPCRSRAGWARYLEKGKSLDHWVNEYYDKSSKRWIMFDLDDLYDRDWMNWPMYEENKIADEYLNFGPNQFYTASQAWQLYKKDKSFIKQLKYGSCAATPEQIIKYLFLDFFAVMNCEYNYTFMPMAFDKPLSEFNKKELKAIDDLAALMSDVDKNFDKLNDLFNNEPKFRMLNSPLVGSSNFKPLIKAKGYKI